MTELAYTGIFDGPLELALERLKSELAKRGFGILANLQVHEILLEKLGTQVDPLVILEVCSPRHALRALSTSRESALLLPCKVVVSREAGRIRIALLRPTVAIDALLHLPSLRELGAEVEDLLRSAVDATIGGAA